MTDYTELKRLAESAQDELVDINQEWPTDGDYFDCQSGPEFEYICAANPAAILDLIAENEELGRYLCTCRECGGEVALHTGDWHSYGHMEPPEPVMEKCGECDGTGLLGEIQDLYQVITERDQLRAEIAGLQTGYKAYEKVNAELKAENERLRDGMVQIIEMNRMHAECQYGDPEKAEAWSCVTVARKAIGTNFPHG
jgi:hypothetical protein